MVWTQEFYGSPLQLEPSPATTTVNGRKPTVSRQQLPITPAYAFTKYHSQGQTIEHYIVDVSAPPNRPSHTVQHIRRSIAKPWKRRHPTS
ncbi:hypothetical protein SCLCIDRAFT_1208217 [Scleroderma citrinum Foug A]|uniref:Uncharacterized protein n=1 Tax=Scleroderma citrinum Foug A TaxID=1036808 RepID=A0A0C3A7N6_9AGAM|nr:hypothetical protein SCLCIDRAFT_1208217 [Scleroderma citrinum Foug A]